MAIGYQILIEPQLEVCKWGEMTARGVGEFGWLALTSPGLIGKTQAPTAMHGPHALSKLPASQGLQHLGGGGGGGGVLS